MNFTQKYFATCIPTLVTGYFDLNISDCSIFSVLVIIVLICPIFNCIDP